MFFKITFILQKYIFYNLLLKWHVYVCVYKEDLSLII